MSISESNNSGRWDSGSQESSTFLTFATSPPKNFPNEFCLKRYRHAASSSAPTFASDKGARATPTFSAREGERLGFEVDIVDMFGALDGVVSSTRIRQALLAGDVETATRMLDRPYQLNGEVVEGDRRGQRVGVSHGQFGDRSGQTRPGQRRLRRLGAIDGAAQIESELAGRDQHRVPSHVCWYPNDGSRHICSTLPGIYTVNNWRSTS